MQAIDGQTIRARRRELDMTLSEGAKGICSVSYLSMIENGKRPIHPDMLALFTSRLGLNEVNTNSKFTQEALFTAGVIAIRAEKFADVDEILASLPTSPWRRALLALRHETKGKHRESIDLLRELVAEDSNPQLFLLVANSLVRQLLEMGDANSMLEVGEYALRKVISEKQPIDDAIVELKGSLAAAYAQLGNLERGLELTRNPRSPLKTKWGDVVEDWSRASVLFHAGEMHDAALAYRSAFDAMSEFDRPVSEAKLLQAAVLCEALSGDVDLTLARADLGHAIKIFEAAGLTTELAESHAALALVEELAGDKRAARSACESALVLAAQVVTSRRPEILINIAERYIGLNDQETALALIQQAQESLHEDEPRRLSANSWSKIAKLMERLGDSEAAYRAMKNSVTLIGITPKLSRRAPYKHKSGPEGI